MNLNLLKCLKEQDLYDEQISKTNDGNLCPSMYKKVTSVYYTLNSKESLKENEKQQRQLDSLKILTFNIAEFVEQRQSLAQIEKVISSNEIQNQVDIICLTEILAETWNQFVTERKVKKQNIPHISEIHLNGVNYYCFINFSKQESQRSKGKYRVVGIENNNTAGCAILISEKLGEIPHTVMFDICPTQELQKMQGLDQESCEALDQEGRLITALFKDFCILTAYAPNYSKKYETEFNTWQQSIITYIMQLQENIKDTFIIFSGDLNINPSHQTYSNLTQLCNLEEIQGVSNTFYSSSSSSLRQIKLDYTFISKNNTLFNKYRAQEVKQFDLLVSLPKFHIPIYCVLEKVSQTNSHRADDDDDDDDADDLEMIKIAQSIQSSQIKQSQDKSNVIANGSSTNTDNHDSFDELNFQFNNMNLEERKQCSNSQQYKKLPNNEILSKSDQSSPYKNRSFNNPKQIQKSAGVHTQFKIPNQISDKNTYPLHQMKQSDIEFLKISKISQIGKVGQDYSNKIIDS